MRKLLKLFSNFFEVKSNIYIRAQDIDTGLGRLGRIDWPRDIYIGTRTLKKSRYENVIKPRCL